MWFKNLFKKRKHYDVLDLKKVEAEYGPPRFNLCEPMTARVIPLDDVQSFVIYEEDDMMLDMIAERGFKLEELNDNWWICRRCKNC